MSKIDDELTKLNEMLKPTSSATMMDVYEIFKTINRILREMRGYE